MPKDKETEREAPFSFFDVVGFGDREEDYSRGRAWLLDAGEGHR